MKYYYVIGKRVKAIRETKGISIDEFALNTGLIPEVITAIERGERDIHLSTFISISEALGVCLCSLMPDSFFDSLSEKES